MSSEISGLVRAAQIARVQPSTVREWCLRYGIGRKDGARWYVDRKALRRIMRARAELGRVDA